MNVQITIYIATGSEAGFEIVVLPIIRLQMRFVVEAKETNEHDFIPDRRIYTLRLLGKPSLGQSPP